MQYSTLEPFEEEQAQAQAQAQGQAQESESGEQQQYQEQAQVQVSDSSSSDEAEESGEVAEPKKGSSISMNVSKLIIFLMVAVFLTISLMLESGEKSPVQKVMDALRNPLSLLLIVLVGVLYASIRVMKLLGKFTEKEYETFMTVERHANVAFILVLFEAIGMRFTSYWIVWIATLLHI